LARWSAGIRIAINSAMIATTTNSSIRVNALRGTLLYKQLPKNLRVQIIAIALSSTIQLYITALPEIEKKVYRCRGENAK
jgi:hypothetical protein